MEALADEQGRRWTGKKAARRLMERGEFKKGKRERLEKRRRDEEGMGLSMSRMRVEPEDYWDESGSEEEKTEDDDDDEQMVDVEKRRDVGDYHAKEDQLVKVRPSFSPSLLVAGRVFFVVAPQLTFLAPSLATDQTGKASAAFHKPSTFLNFLAQHLSSLVPPPPVDEDLLRWDVLLSTTPTTKPTALYLRKKLGLEEGATFVSASGRSVEVRVGEDVSLFSFRRVDPTSSYC